MNMEVYEQFFDALRKIVHEDKPCADKIAEMKAWMGEQEDINLEEFLSWFDKV